MDRFRKTFSVRKKKECDSSESSKPQLWIEDEKKIKEGSCSFQVKYLGCIEVFESRGMQVCEEAIKALRKSKKKTQRAILYVSGDALRVSDEISKHLIVDQTIEKVSFCAPDRGHDKGFAYICRDGATRRWMCHAFLAVKESGERLSHAVGCAFAICLEKKQKRERDAVQATYTNDDSTFIRMSSFRQTSLSERLLDPQSAIVVDNNVNMPTKSHLGDTTPDNGAVAPLEVGVDKTASLPKPLTGAIPRPRANPSLIERQTSLRLFPKLQESSPFKHSLSMRSGGENTSTLQRSVRLMNGAAIPEETPADSEDPSSRGPSAETTTTTIALMSRTPDSVLFSSPNTSVAETLMTKRATTPAFPVSFEEVNSSGPLDNVPLPSVDPFSAAPFNPATIQQHHAAQQQLQSQSKETSPIPPPRVSPATVASSTSAVPNVSPSSISDWPALVGGGSSGVVSTPFAPHGTEAFSTNSLFTQTSLVPSICTLSPPIASMSSAQPSSANTQSLVPHSHSMTLFGADSKSSPPATTGPSELTLVRNPQLKCPPSVPAPWIPGQLPPEPTSFSDDPFDLGWAERATAMAKGQLEACTVSPILPPPAQTPFGASPAVPGVPTNPFLNPFPDRR